MVVNPSAHTVIDVYIAVSFVLYTFHALDEELK